MIVSTVVKSCSTALFGACLVILSPVPSQAANIYSAYYAFGDSLSDAGNDYHRFFGELPKSPPYYKGHFSNGPTWTDDVSKALGFGALVPSEKGGTNYAYGGATASRSVPDSHPEIPTTSDQVTTYLNKGSADPKALYSMWIGANDVIDALIGIGAGTLSFADAQADLTISVASEVSDLQRLVGAGANHLLIGLLPDIGLTPLFNTTSQKETGSTLASYYNSLLLSSATLLLPNSNLTFFDTFKLIDDAVANPASFGLTDATTACWTGTFEGTGGTLCGDPDDHLFFDHLHPTEVGHSFVANLALKELGVSVAPVPLPSSMALYGAALAGLGLIGVVSRRKIAQLGQRA